MKLRNGTVVALLFLATCSEEATEQSTSKVESAREALGKVPASEVAVWQKVGSSTIADGRYLQAVAFDETRRVFVMFGGASTDPNTGTIAPNQETWEWSPATGKWTNRTVASSEPDARSGAAMVFDSARNKFVLFGGRAGSGYDYEDTWEWDPATGLWTDVSAGGSHPTARSQHGMVYEKSTGKVLLFGGGRSVPSSYDPAQIQVATSDTWEYDPTTHAWAALSVATSPSARHGFGMAWDSSRNKAVLFAGMQTDVAGVSGIPKQDTWEWDPTTSTWAERTAQGSKPSQRYAHAMAFDGVRKKIVVFGGWDIGSGGSRNDVWDWEPTTGAWTQRLTGSEVGMPSPRMYASMVADDTGARLELVAGLAAYSYGNGGTGGYYGTGGSYVIGGYYGSGGAPAMPIGVNGPGTGSREVWELNPVTPAFTDRTPPLDLPTARYSQAMAYNPSTGKTYIFGGYDAMSGQALDDLWEWDGKTWAQVATDVRPPARSDAGLAYDPARKSLILYGGSYYTVDGTGDTWEWAGGKKWTQLKPANSPPMLSGHGMVADTTRNKILLFGGLDMNQYIGQASNEVWEWDGTLMTWTNRTPPGYNVPEGRQYPVMAYDEGRQKLFVYDGNTNYGNNMSAFWEWDPVSAGWTRRDSGDTLDYGYYNVVAYDSIRRREVLLTNATSSSSGYLETWELDAKGPTWYVRSMPASPGPRYGATMVFDSARGVAVLFGGQNANSGTTSNETWEYKVSSLGNGEGCNAAFAASCASGNCVDGVCCNEAACTGACKSCNVAGSEGTCVLAQAGTEVATSCLNGLACDGSGNCKAKNGEVCTAGSTCASGNCADGVCCDSACTGTCASCKQVGRIGKCSPYPAGTDPQGECGKGTGVCKSTCDGVGSCDYPQMAVTCGTCLTCDGMGTCTNYDYNCGYYGGTGGYWVENTGGTGGRYIGGAGGRDTSRGGSTGYGGNVGGAAGFVTIPLGAGGAGASSSGGPTGAGGAGDLLPDGAVGDATTDPTLHRSSGCQCEVGQARRTNSGLVMPFLAIGAALLLAQRRRRKS